MLQQLLHSVIVSAICIAWGLPVLLIWRTSIHKDDFWYRSVVGMLSFLFFSGCIVLSFLTAWLSLFCPLHFVYVLIGTLWLVGCLVFFARDHLKEAFKGPGKTHLVFRGITVAFLFAGTVLFLLLSALQPVNNDTQLYHLQVIRWQHEYGSVPGIANLYPRLGLNSNWLSLISFFYLPSFKNENFTFLNLAFVFWFFVWLLSNWNFYLKEFKSDPRARIMCLFYFLILTYCLFDWQLFRDAANSTNFDFPVNAFLFIIFSYFIEGIVYGNKRNHFSLPLVMFCFAIVGFKFSGIFIFLLVAYYLVALKSLPGWITSAAVAVLFLLPVFVRNYITSGYPVFPNTFTFSRPDWQLPKLMAERFYSYILLSNKFYNHHLSFAFGYHSTTFDWIPFWWHGILLKHKIVIALTLLSVVFIFIKPRVVSDYSTLRHMIIVLLLMIAGWFFTAPDPGRFGYGMLLTAAFLFVSLSAQVLFIQKVYVVLIAITTVIMCYYFFQKSNHLDLSQYWRVPVPVQRPAYSIIRNGKAELHLPQRVDSNTDFRCYFTTLPCITQENPYLELRGASAAQGFRMKTVIDSSFILNYDY